MEIRLYRRKYDKHYINVSTDNGALLNEWTFNNVVFKDAGSLDVINPTVVYQDPENEINAGDLNGYNYMYIPQLRSWYWMKWHTEGGLIVFKGERDPFKTFINDIRNSKQYITRAQRLRNYLVVDNQLPIHSDHNYKAYMFGDPVYKKNCNNVILETVGKGGTVS